MAPASRPPLSWAGAAVLLLSFSSVISGSILGDGVGLQEANDLETLNTVPDTVNLGPGINEKRQSWGFEPLLSSLTSTFLHTPQHRPVQVENNRPSRAQIAPGDIHHFVFPYAQTTVQFDTRERSVPHNSIAPDEHLSENGQHADLRRELEGHTVYLSLSLCALPSGEGRDSASRTGLDLVVQANDDSARNFTSKQPQIRHIETDEGLAIYKEQFSSDLYFAVQAPHAQTHLGHYTYEITASIDTWYTNFDETQSLVVVDQDHQAGLLTSFSLADHRDPAGMESWMASDAPFTIFIHPQDDTDIFALRRSYCGLESNALIQTSSAGVQKAMTMAGSKTAKQKFYVPGLNSSTTYHAIMGLPSNYSTRGSGTPTGGGLTYRSTEFTTSTDGSCLVLHDLEFCDSVSYAVPSPANDSVDATELGNLYDSYAQSLYANFSFSLQQIACNTTPEAQYSLATNCSNCATAYKQWLCAVTIPRCADTSKNTSASIPRNASTSRSPFIQQQIVPGSYNELPPCGKLCYGLVQHCPAKLGFFCPQTGSWYFNQSYGYPGGPGDEPSCNSPDDALGYSAGFLGYAPNLFRIGSAMFILLMIT